MRRCRSPGSPAVGRERGALDLDVHVLGINDFHGNLEPPTGSSGRITTPPTARRSTPAAPPTWRPTSNLRARGPERTIVVVGSGDLIGAVPAHLGALPRRADHRGAQPRAAGLRRRQPRVRRGLPRAAAHAARRLPPDGRLPGRRPVLRRGLPVAGRQRPIAGTDRTILPPLLGAGVGTGVLRRLHRAHARGHADHRHPGGRRRPDLRRRGRRRSTATSSCSQRRASSSFVVLIHEGGQQNPPYADGFQDVNGCENLSGDDRPHRGRTCPRRSTWSPSAHTHQPYICDAWTASS